MEHRAAVAIFLLILMLLSVPRIDDMFPPKPPIPGPAPKGPMSLFDALISSYRARLTEKARALASLVPVRLDPSLRGARTYYMRGPQGSVETERISPALLFHELGHIISHPQGSEFISGMWGATPYPMQQEAQRVYERTGMPWSEQEYYSMVGDRYHWDPAAMPSDLRQYYIPWFRMSPDPRNLGFREYPKTGYPTVWTGGP